MPVGSAQRYWDSVHSESPGRAATTWAAHFVDYGLGSGKRVLVVGSGDCYFPTPIDHSRLVNLDVSRVALRRAVKHRGEDTDLVLADASKQLPFRDGSFGLAFSVETLTLLGERCLPAIREMARVADRIAFEVTHADCANEPKGETSQLELGKIVYHEDKPDNMYFTEEEIKTFLEREGMTLESMQVLTMHDLLFTGAPVYQVPEITPETALRAAILAVARK